MRCLEKAPVKRWPDAKSLALAATGSEGDDLPAQLEGLGSFLLTPLIGALVLACLGAWWLGGGDVSDPFPLLSYTALIGAGVPLLLFPGRWIHLRRLGFGPRRIVSAVLAPLHQWLGWHPRRFRRKGDVWDLLPSKLRHLRVALGWLVVASCLTLPAVVFEAASHSLVLRTGHRPLELAAGAVGRIAAMLIVPALAAAVGLSVRFELFCRRHGVDAYASTSMLRTPTFKRSFWSRPDVARFLTPQGHDGTGGKVDPTSARDLASAITAAVTGLGGVSGLAGQRAREAVQRIQASLVGLDAEIASLSAGADSSEAERLAARIAALGAPHTGEGEAKAQMRDLLEKQLALLRGVDSRVEALKVRRGRQLDLLRALWQQAQVLGSAGVDPSRTRGATERIHALCAEVAEQADSPIATPDLDPAISEAPTMDRGRA